MPSHARSQPGLCNMYQVRRAPTPPGPSRPRPAGATPGHAPARQQQQVLRACMGKAHLPTRAGPLLRGDRQGTRYEDGKLLFKSL